MERKNFAKKIIISALVASFAIGTLAACQDSNSATGTTSKTARDKTSTYSTK